MPSYTSHILQPLDLCGFSFVKTHYHNNIEALSQFDDALAVKKDRFIYCYNLTRQEGFITRNIRAGWKRAGLVPYNKEVPLRLSFVFNPQIGPRPQTPPQRKRPRSHSFETLRNEQQLQRAVRTFGTAIRVNNKMKSLMSKAGKALTIATTSVAELEGKVIRLQQELEQYTVKAPKKAIQLDANTKFVTVEEIKKAITEVAISTEASAAKSKAKVTKTPSKAAAEPVYSHMCTQFQS